MPIKRGIKAQQTIEELSKQVAALRVALEEQSELLPLTYSNIYHEPFFQQSLSSLGGLLASQFLSAGIGKSMAPDLWSMSIDRLVIVLQGYNEMAIAAPFALCLDVNEISKTVVESPVLVIAALNVSPSLELHTAKQLDFVFHRVLADQAMVQGKQNLDILSGLVTYLLWFHHRYDPETQQFFQYLQLAKAMVEDLQLGKCLESGNDPICGVPRISVARILAGLYFIDQGTSKLDDTRQRQPMSVDNVQVAIIAIHNSNERRADVDAKHITKLLCSDLVSEGSLLFGTDWQVQQGSCLCRGTIECFSVAWISLQYVKSMPALARQSRDYMYAAEQLKGVVDHVRQQATTYLQTMTIVEWAYLLTVLVKIPHLEGCASGLLSGCTNQMVAALRSYLLAGQQMNPELLRQSKHLWWLEGILNDAESIVAAPRSPLTSYELLISSPYELLEQLTERLTGFRKGIKIEEKPHLIEKSIDDEKFDQILTEWVQFD